MAIPYPQVCPDSRSFAPGEYATTEPAYLDYVQSGREWAGVPFGSELQLGYEDLSEAEAALFTDAYEDSRSGFHVLDIGAEPAGGIGDAGLAARITATDWKFAERPVIEAKGAGRYRVSVKLTSELPTFVDVAVAGISVPGSEAALSWLDASVGGQVVCSGPFPAPLAGARFLIIGNPYYSLGVADPTAVESNPTADFIGVQNAIYVSDMGAGQPGFVVKYGGRLTRDEQAGSASFHNLSEMAGFDLDLNLLWRINSLGIESGVYLYTFEAAAQLSLFPGGRVGYYGQTDVISGSQSRLELHSCFPDGSSPSRHAYYVASTLNSFIIDDIQLSADDELFMRLGQDFRVASIDASMNAKWFYRYLPSAPLTLFSSYGSCLQPGTGNFYLCGGARITGFSGFAYDRAILGSVDTNGNPQAFYYYNDTSADRPANLTHSFLFFSVAFDPSGSVIACGHVDRGLPGSPDFGFTNLCVARINPANGAVIAAKAYKYTGANGELFNECYVTVGDDESIYVTANSYFSDAGINPSNESLVTVYKLAADLSLTGAVNIVAAADYGYTYGRPSIIGGKLAVPAVMDGGPWLPSASSSAPTDGLLIFIPTGSIGSAAAGDYGSIENGGATGFTVRDMTGLFAVENLTFSVNALTVSKSALTITNDTPGAVSTPKEPAYVVLEKLPEPEPDPYIYSQSSVYSFNEPATYAAMTDGSHTSFTTQTGTNGETDSWIKVDLGSVVYVASVNLGCDFDNVLAGVWGKAYSEGSPIEISSNNTTWTVVGNTGTFSAPIQNYAINASCRYIRVVSTLDNLGYLALTEFNPLFA